MDPRFPLSLAAALLIAASVTAGAGPLRVGDPSVGSSTPMPIPVQPGIGDPQAGPDAMTDSQNFALVAGQILGAAAACEQINEERISDATKQAVRIAKDSADDQADIDAAQQHMLDGAQTARNAVVNGSADCDRVSNAFSQLEWIEQNTQKLQSQLDDPDAAPDDQGTTPNDQTDNQDNDE